MNDNKLEERCKRCYAKVTFSPWLPLLDVVQDSRSSAIGEAFRKVVVCAELMEDFASAGSQGGSLWLQITTPRFLFRRRKRQRPIDVD